MKTLELLERSLKKCSTQQLIQKLEKFNPKSEEYDICMQLLERRGQDVSKWKIDTVSEEIKTPIHETIQQEANPPTLGELKEQVDQFVDELIVAKRTSEYTEVMKALGGDYESDLDDLFGVVTMEQLLAALELKNTPSPLEKETSSKVKKEKVQKEKSTKTKDSPKEGSKSAEILSYLKTNPEEPLSRVAKHFNTGYPFISHIKKTYLK